MKFGQLIEYNTTKIFVEKPYTKCDGETIPRSFSKKSKLSISLDQQSKVFLSLLLLFTNLRAIEICSNHAADHLFLSYTKIFLKKKKRSGTSLPSSFSA